MSTPRLSKPTTITMTQFLRSDRPLCGYDIIKSTRLASGTLYPLLKRLENAGWLTSKPENIDPVVEGRPARTLYSVTKLGKAEATKMLLRSTKNSSM